MRGLLALLAFAGFAAAQAPGTITIQQNVTATAGGLVCVFSNPARPTVHVACTISGTTELTMDMTPAVGSTNGSVGSHSNAGNTVTWIIQQPTAGTVTWQIAANGTSQSGNF